MINHPAVKAARTRNEIDNSGNWKTICEVSLDLKLNPSDPEYNEAAIHDVVQQLTEWGQSNMMAWDTISLVEHK